MIAVASYPYADTVVLVTGGGTGIGRAICRGFLEQGAKVVVVGRTMTALREATSGFLPEQVHILVADLAVEGAATAAVQDAVTHFGRVDVVVASAGTSEPSDVEQFDQLVWKRLRAINIDSLIELATASAVHLKHTRGNFLAISSIAGTRGEWGMFAYTATKAAVNGLVQSLALDLGASGVRVNAIAPGFTTSRLTEARLADPEFRASLLNRIALGRPAEPDDIARTALFLCSPDAGYITGVVIPVDGGISASNGAPHLQGC
jgi:meso-butanediol dehydrogenase/(S,S)-butanediol dehydrogenase/diacetyl reductase